MIYLRRANSSDAEFLAWVTLAASRSHLPRGLWDVILGADEAGCLDYLTRLAVAEPRSLYHYSSYVVAEIDGERVSALCGFKPQDGGWAIAGEAMSSVQRDLGWTEAQAAASYQRVAGVWAVCMPPDAGAAYEKADFKVQDEKHCTYLEKLLGAQGFVRLRREL